jgi:hypothetical protein
METLGVLRHYSMLHAPECIIGNQLNCHDPAQYRTAQGGEGRPVAAQGRVSRTGYFLSPPTLEKVEQNRSHFLFLLVTQAMAADLLV